MSFHLGIEDALEMKSSLRSPRPVTPKGSVRFGDDNTPRSIAASNNAAGGSETSSTQPKRGGGKPKGPTPLTSLAPTAGTIANQIAAIHDLIMASDLAPLKKKTCHLHLFDADRLLMGHFAAQDNAKTKRRLQQQRSADERASAFTAKNVAAAAAQASTTTSQPAANQFVDPLSLSVGGGSSRPAGEGAASESGLSKSALRRARAQASWDRFLKAVSGNLSPGEVELLSLATIKKLMHHYGIDRDAVDVANIELFWRNLAQAREDQRNERAIINKQCAAAPEPTKKRAARELSATFDKRSDKRR